MFSVLTQNRMLTHSNFGKIQQTFGARLHSSFHGVIIVNNNMLKINNMLYNHIIYIFYVQIGEGIDKFMSEVRWLGREGKQPFILAICEKFCPTQTFVVIEKHLIEVNSLLKAVNICFYTDVHI